LLKDEARNRALGEAIERYSAVATAATAAGEFRPLSECEILDRFFRCADDEPCPESFRRRELTCDVEQVPLKRLADDRELLIPAEFVHLRLPPLGELPDLMYPISTGIAFRPQLHSAIWSGLCEVVERDALMLVWWSRLAVSRLECCQDTAPFALLSRLELLEQSRLRACLFDITSDFLVPTVFCLLLADGFPFAAAGAACHADPVTACAKAIDEAVAVRAALRGFPPSTRALTVDNFDWVQSLEQHGEIYARWPASPALDFLGRDLAPVDFNTFAARDWWQEPEDWQQLAALAGRLMSHDLTVLWADLTCPEARPLGHVVKVVVPEMVPLSQDHRVRWLGTRRLVQSAQQHGVAGFNPYPHPFA
jgi:ribosomal protein S12 methylthiotransferase accessory factor